MSSVYSQSDIGTRTPVEQRIYQISNVDSTETISTVSIRPCLNPAVPRMRILLAPYMSPYVVPVHKVKTWERLRTTVNALFGEQVFNGKELRVTDQTGRIIFPSAWADFIAPDVTIIVDTCSHLPKGSPVIFDTPSYAPATESYGMGLLRRLSESCRGRRSVGYENIESVTAMVLAERESEDHAYETRMTSTLADIQETTDLAPMEPPRSRLEMPSRLYSENPYEKRQTCISMFIPARGARPRARHSIIAKKPTGPARRSLDRRSSRELKRSATEVYRSVNEKQNYPGPPSPPELKPLKRNKSKWFKVSRVVLYACSRPNRESTHPLPSISEKSHYHHNPVFTPHDTPRKPSNPQNPIPKVTIEPVTLDTGRPTFDRTAYPQRSKSLGAVQRFNAALNSDQKSKPTKLIRSSSQQSKLGTQQPRNKRISPPVPQPPVGQLGLNPQFAMQTTVSVDRIRELSNPRKAHDNASQYSVATTSRIPEVKRNEKPLPKLPGGYSLFPVVPQSPGLPDADRRPPNATPLILRQPGAATKVRNRFGTPDGKV